MNLKKILVLLLFIINITTVLAQEKTITGTVTDDTGPLPGVSIIIKGTNTGAETNFDGKYIISANAGDVLVYSFVGMITQEKTVGTSNVINVTLAGDSLLDEVVVVAYGKQSKKKLITSITKVDNAAIKDLVVDSPQNILQGQASGVQVVSSSGNLGAAPDVRIRGVNSIGSNSRPLFVIDGVVLGDTFVPTDGQGTGQGINPLSNINPNDIESISVLKSAAAAALYGSRGGNGVVLITTKSGSKDGKVTVTLDINTSFSDVTDTPDLLNAEQYISFRNLFRAPDAQITSLVAGADFDYIDAVLRTAVSQSYNLSVRGGNEAASYFLSATREDQEGILKGNDLERTSFRANVTSKVNNWLTATLNTNVSHNRFDRVPAENNFSSPYTVALLQRPDVTPFDADGNFSTFGAANGGNVLAQEELNLNLATNTRIIGNAALDFNLSSLVDGLSFRQDIGVDRASNENQRRQVDFLTTGGSANNSIFQQNRFVANSILSYNKTFGGKHNVSALVGTSYEENAFRDIRVSGTGFLADFQQNIESANTFPVTFSSGDANSLVSYLSRVTYDYNGLYVFEASARRDGSSRFGANNKFGTFWSAAAGWNMSDESFMESVNWVQGLKLNASYGTSGNDRIGNFPSLGVFAVDNFDGESGLRPSTLPNPDLKWESTTTFDVGLTASFFNRRLTFNVEYYKKVTDDLILRVPVDPTFNNGLNLRFENIGELENRGVDLTVSSINFNTEAFKWTSSLNLGFNTNEVTSLPETANVDERGNRFVAQGGGSLAFSGQRAVLGESSNSFYLIPYIGVNSQTGDAEWLDANDNPTTAPTDADRRVVGQANPDLVGGFTNVFTYKNWSLNTLFNFSFGNDVLLTTREFIGNPGGSFNKTTDLLNVWQQPGDIAFTPRVGSSTLVNFSQSSTAQLEDASFVRLKNVTLNYTLPQRLVDDLFINSVRLYATATNLATFKKSGLDGYDPEVSNGSNGQGAVGQDFFGVPQAKTFTFGVNISF